MIKHLGKTEVLIFCLESFNFKKSYFIYLSLHNFWLGRASGQLSARIMVVRG